MRVNGEGKKEGFE